RFTPATCGGKPVASERPIIIGDMDIDMGMAEIRIEKNAPMRDKKATRTPIASIVLNPSILMKHLRRESRAQS
ncbi:MAG: hypothetical protein WAM80_18700, partial [Candidatus Acidiferrales bacterium]